MSSTPSNEFYISSGVEPEQAKEWGERLYQTHRLKTLRDLAEQFNHYAPPDEPHLIDMSRDRSIIELIFELWLRRIDIPNVLTFGQPYDAEFRRWIEMSQDCDITTSPTYRLLQHPDGLYNFLYFSLLLPSQHIKITNNHCNAIAQQNLKDLNRYWIKLPIAKKDKRPLEWYEDLRTLLRQRQLIHLDLVYVALVSDYENLYNVGLDLNTYLESVGFHPFAHKPAEDNAAADANNNDNDDQTDLF
jgi:hypothetical protein